MARPSVLLVTAPGATRERLAVEAELARRGWPRAGGPAAADLVVFAGAPGPVREDGREDAWAERVWESVPAPKARVTVTRADDAAHALDRGRAALHGPARPAEAQHHPRADTGTDHGDHGDHEDHGAHEHHGHHMGVVAGLPMAERADDRDGLRLDLLHVPLGPALPDWPAGLVVHAELQGDVVRRAGVEEIPAAHASRPAFWSEPWLRAAAGEPVTVGEAARRRCAAHLDSVGRFLAVAGWREPAVEARRARDRILAGEPVSGLRARVHPWARRVRRSWTLRRLMAGVGVLSAERARRHGVTGPALLADGDVHARLLVWLTEIERALDDGDDPAPLDVRAPLNGPRGLLDADTPPSRALLDLLPGLLEGTEFACARLVVASLDPDLDELAPQHSPTGHAHG